jgi:alkanesulfonate monooxygenase SsuD/methylene tetrahydromethanopterin reductase-like flavin-dependent oxidoreductase (luciferase family)
MRLAVVNLLRSAKESVEIAKACEAGGFWGIGLGDTAPKLYQDTYATAGACFAATRTLNIGPTVTNTVARHWSVLGATARTFNELYPGRFFAGLATGDGACHSVGLTPASWARVEKDVASVREMAPKDFQIQIAISGPRGAEAAGRVADDLIIGTGLDVQALKNLSARARAARKAARVTKPLRVWAFITTTIAPDQAAVDHIKKTQPGRAMGTARFSFSQTFEDKAVPEKWQATLKERLARYDFAYHGQGGDNPNARLFLDVPELQAYLVNRFQLLGTADECLARLTQVSKDAELDGVWFSISPMTPDDDIPTRVRIAGEVFKPLATAS